MARRRSSKRGVAYYVPFWVVPFLLLVLTPLYLYASVKGFGFVELIDEHILAVSAFIVTVFGISVLGGVLDATCRCPGSFPVTLLVFQMLLVSAVLAVSNMGLLTEGAPQIIGHVAETDALTVGALPVELPPAHEVQAAGTPVQALRNRANGQLPALAQDHSSQIKGPPDARSNGDGVPPAPAAPLKNHWRPPGPPADIRDPECKPEHERIMALPKLALPNTSVIFTFCNEPAWSLHNSMYSVIEMSPRHLLHEIILVDDGSDAPHLGKPLEDHVKTLPVPVKIVRTGHQGLMRARVAGAKVATGDTITVLDSHIHCQRGWLEPLMHRISQGREHVVMPMIDGIDKQWKYTKGGIELIGFNTGLVDHGIRLQKKHDFAGRKATDPQPSPAMAGGLFSIHREYFFEIGAFDEGMYHWGGENIEIGFRVWQCGGSIELIPCSRVGHLWGGMGANCPWKGAAPGTRNKWRAIEVWMDKEHQDMMKEFLPYPPEGTGDLTIMRGIRDKLHCKNFDYFLEKAYPECWMTKLKTAAFKGVFRNVGIHRCMMPERGDSRGLRVADCDTERKQYNMQYYYLTADAELLLNARNGDIDQCAESGFSKDDTLAVYGCHGQRGNQEWTYDISSKEFKHGQVCLEMSANKVFIDKCNASPEQQWEWVDPA